MSRERLVLSFDHKDLGTNLLEQKAAVAKTAPAIVDFVEEGRQVAVTRSNAPQVGMVHGAFSESTMHYKGYTSLPPSACSVMSQDHIGYDLQNRLRSEFLFRGVYKCVSTIMTEVTADPYDEVFYQSLKTIGRSMTKEGAGVEDARNNHMVETPGEGYQRIVPMPNPVVTVEVDATKTLPDAGQVVICCGGGDMPTLKQGMTLRGADAIIEKDLTFGLPARGVDVDVLPILTAVDNVTLNSGTPVKEAVSEMSVDDAKTYMEAEQLEFKNMFPKVKAVTDLVSAGRNRAAIITSPAKIGQALRDKAGARISWALPIPRITSATQRATEKLFFAALFSFRGLHV